MTRVDVHLRLFLPNLNVLICKTIEFKEGVPMGKGVALQSDRTIYES